MLFIITNFLIGILPLFFFKGSNLTPPLTINLRGILPSSHFHEGLGPPPDQLC